MCVIETRSGSQRRFRRPWVQIWRPETSIVRQPPPPPTIPLCFARSTQCTGLSPRKPSHRRALPLSPLNVCRCAALLQKRQAMVLHRSQSHRASHQALRPEAPARALAGAATTAGAAQPSPTPLDLGCTPPDCSHPCHHTTVTREWPCITILTSRAGLANSLLLRRCGRREEGGRGRRWLSGHLGC
jgi:hypothetical protein